ncbi:MAG: esterase/lipase family protein [Longimicrobiales bacterium]
MKANPFSLVLFVLLGAPGGWATASAQVSSSRGDSTLAPPSAPVLLVPGWLRGAKELVPLSERLVRDGWPEDWVQPLEFRDPVGSNLDHAVEIEEAIAALQARTNRRLVDVIAHSMGGLALWALLQRKGDLLPIRRVVFLGSPLQGTLIAHLAWGEGGEEMRPGSDFLKNLEEGPDPGHWVEALTIRTPLDLTVVPNRGGTLPGMGDRLVCCPTHQGLQDHEETFVLARNFLLYGRGGGVTAGSGFSGRR